MTKEHTDKIDETKIVKEDTKEAVVDTVAKEEKRESVIPATLETISEKLTTLEDKINLGLEQTKKTTGWMMPAAFLIGSMFIATALLRTGGLPADSGGYPQANNNAAPSAPTVSLVDVAKKAGVTARNFNQCVKDKQYDDNVAEDIASGLAAGVRGTPAGFIVEASTGRALQFEGGASPFSTLSVVLEDVFANGLPQDQLIDTLAPVTDADYIKGNANADYYWVEYSDFDCPFCARFHGTMNEVVAAYGDKIGWVYRHFPLEQIHPDARNKAIASECVGEMKGDEGFWQFTDAVLAG